MKDEEARKAIDGIKFGLKILDQCINDKFTDNAWYVKNLVQRLEDFERTGKFREYP
jgi:hypothetical protein